MAATVVLRFDGNKKSDASNKSVCIAGQGALYSNPTCSIMNAIRFQFNVPMVLGEEVLTRVAAGAHQEYITVLMSKLEQLANLGVRLPRC